MKKNKNNKTVNSILNNVPAAINDNDSDKTVILSKSEIKKTAKSAIIKEDDIEDIKENGRPFFIKKMPVIDLNNNGQLKDEMPINETSENNLDENNDRKKELNMKWFDITKRQLRIASENARLVTKIFEIDWEYSSEFDDFVASIIGKKSAPLEKQMKQNQAEYAENEIKLEIIEKELKAL